MTRRNSRSSAQEALLAPSPTTTPPDEKKPVERTETPKADIRSTLMSLCRDQAIGDDDGIEDSWPVAKKPSPEDYISKKYDIAPNCTNVPRLLYAILCEVVRGRV